jgi:hypothetical protein
LYLTMDQAVYSIPISQGALFAFKWKISKGMIVLSYPQCYIKNMAKDS